MKKTTATILFISLFYNIFSQTYKAELKAVNDYLKTFDKGYYGYVEIKDGFLYDRFPSGKYSKSEIKYLGNAVAFDSEYKVSIECTDSKDCVFSTYTDSYHKNISFSQSEYFDKEVLVGLLNDLLSAYKKNTGNYKNDVALIEKKTSTSSNSNYQTALKKLNDYLKTFDNGYYGYFEVINNEVFIRLKAGTYCSALISDLDKAYVVEDYKKIELRCLGGENCMNATYTKGKTTGLKMYQDKSFDTEEFTQLINDLISTLKNNKTNTPNNGNEAVVLKPSTNNSNNSTSNYSTKSTSNNSSTGNYQTALKKLNDYLATFDNGYYGYFEVKDGYIYDRFKAGKYNKFKMEDIEGAVIQEQYSRVIFKCKSGNCISTDWKENGKEEYTQFTKSGSYNYQELADLLNNFRDAYLSKKQTSSNNSTVSANKSREQQAQERQQSKNTKITNKNANDDFDEDWDALEKTAAKLNNSTKEVKESTGTLRAILYDKEIILTDIDNSDPNFDKAKKHIGKKGKTKTYIIPNDDNLTFYGDIYFDGILFKFKKIRIKEVTANENTSSTSSNKNYTEPLKKLNEYLKTFNAETYRDVEVKDNKVYFAFFVYGAKYNSSIDISELKNNTIITIGKSVGSSVVDEVKISCKGENKCFYSLYSNSSADHFRFFSHSVKDFTKMEQLLKDFIKAL